MGRIGEPEDISFKRSLPSWPHQSQGWITAQMLTVDGGRMDYIGISA